MNKSAINSLWVTSGIACLLLFTGCAGVSLLDKITYSGIKPVYPMPFVGDTMYEVTVDSLTPTLKWKAQAGVNQYDVAVWDCSSQMAGWKAENRGQRLFYVKQITDTSVTVTPKLEPDHLYLWSVRASDTQVWSTYKTSDWLGFTEINPNYSKGLNYKFRTPKQTASSPVTPPPAPASASTTP